MDKNDYTLYQSFLFALRYHYYRTHMLLDNIGIYPGQPPLLMILNKKDGISQKELSDMLKIKPATLTMMIKRMEKAGFLERRVDDEDKRKYQVFLTKMGKEKSSAVKQINLQIERECFQNFSEEEKIIMRRLLIQMADNLEGLIGYKCERMEKHD